MLVHLPADHATAAEAVDFARPFDGGGLGFAVGARLLARSGVAIVAALRSFGPVLADARLSGAPSSVVGAARELAAAGAGRITLGPGCGPALVGRVAETLMPRGVVTVVTPVAPEADDDDVEVVTAGLGSGRMTSRIAAAVAALEGVEILGTGPALGVVTQVAPTLGVVVSGVTDTGMASEIRARGARAAILVPGAVADPDGALRYLAVSG